MFPDFLCGIMGKLCQICPQMRLRMKLIWEAVHKEVHVLIQSRVTGVIVTKFQSNFAKTNTMNTYNFRRLKKIKATGLEEGGLYATLRAWSHTPYLLRTMIPTHLNSEIR